MNILTIDKRYVDTYGLDEALARIDKEQPISVEFRNIIFEYFDFDFIKIPNMRFHSCYIDNASFDTNINTIEFTSCSLNNLNFKDALSIAFFKHSYINYSQIISKDLYVTDCLIKYSQFKAEQLLSFNKSSIISTKLLSSGAYLYDTRFDNTQFNLNLSEPPMLTLSGSKLHFSNCVFQKCNLFESTFCNSMFYKTYFNSCEIGKSNFLNRNLKINFTKSIFTECDLSESKFNEDSGAIFIDCDISDMYFINV